MYISLQYLTTMPKKADDKVLVISCHDDKGICDSALKAGVTVVNAEFILTGILRQENAAEKYPFMFISTYCNLSMICMWYQFGIHVYVIW